MEDVIKAIQEFFGAKSLLKEINSTFLVLIPKVPSIVYALGVLLLQ